jgi:phage shock protein A
MVITLQGQQAWLQTIASVQQQTADLRKQSPELIQQIAGLAQSLQQLQKTDWKANEALASQYLQQVDSLCNTTIQQLDKLNPLIEKQNAWILSWQDPKSSIGQWLHATESVDSLHLQLNDLQKTLEDIRLHPEKYRKLL